MKTKEQKQLLNIFLTKPQNYERAKSKFPKTLLSA